MLTVSQSWKEMYPGAAVGILEMDKVRNPDHHEPLDQRKEVLEQQLRDQFASSSRDDLKGLGTIEAYTRYYKQFRKTYHVLLQLESVVHKDKPIPRVAALVEAMFMAEIKNQLLTAGHDMGLVKEPMRVDVATGDERFVGFSGKEQQLKENDMFIADAKGILSSIIYGPDRRTRISANTTHVVFTVYAPAGIEAQQVEQHLQDIESNIHIFAPEAVTRTLAIFGK